MCDSRGARSSGRVLWALFAGLALWHVGAGAASATGPRPAPFAVGPGHSSLAGSAADVPSSWWRAVQADLHEREYAAAWQEPTELADVLAAWQAPNRAQAWRTYFTAAGIRVVPRDGSGAWEWGLRYVDTDRSAASGPAASAGPGCVEDNRVEYDHGAVSEWYVNDERGLEQGFTVFEKPSACISASSPPAGVDSLCIDLEITGTLSAGCGPGGKQVSFVMDAPGGATMIEFGALTAVDASGRLLPARFELADHTLSIVVDDRDAVYPITVDPLATSPSWTAESNKASAQYGYGVATAGDVNADGYSDVIVGAPFYDNGQPDEGRVFAYYGSSGGLNTMADWTGGINVSGALLGNGVATAGDVNGDGYSDIIVGAYFYENGQAEEGGAFVWHGSSTGLGTSGRAADWSAESNKASAQMGYSVATAGDVNGDGFSDVIIGANLNDNGGTNEGAAFVYLGSAAGLGAPGTPANADWTAEGDQNSANFGHSVATAGDVNGDGYGDVIIGAYGYDNGQSNEGRAFVYHGSAGGLSALADWTAEADQADAQFGTSVATAGDVNGDGYADVIIGAPLYDRAVAGEAFIWFGGAGGLGVSGTPSNVDWWLTARQAGAQFGACVGPAGDVNGDGYADVIVGAYLYDNGQADEGAAFVWAGSPGISGGEDENAAIWSAESNQESAQMGFSAATAGDVDGDGYADVIVGSNLSDNGQADEGGAAVYHGSAAGLSATTNWTAESNLVSGRLGQGAATAGDVNGDGYSDVIVGDSYGWGHANVYHGSASGLGATPNWTTETNQGGTLFAYSVATAGDVNGDGYGDVIIGASRYDSGQVDEGRAFAYYGSAGGLSATPNWIAESDQAFAEFGYSVATAGDVNGDGYSDVIVGAYRYDISQVDEGQAFVYHGSATGLSAYPNWTAGSGQASAQSGFSVAAAGDVNGDGFSDVVVGARLYHDGQDGEGRAFVYHGSAAGLSPTPNWAAESNQHGAYFGYSVATAGDVNGDGHSDVIVGAYLNTNGQTSEGQALVYYGSAGGLMATPDWIAESDQTGAVFGVSVASAGDVNGDGYSDVIVGAQYYGNGPTNEGWAFAWLGSETGLGDNGTPSNADWTAESNQGASLFGRVVGTAGDVNGDGYSDVIVAAPYYDNGQTDEGRAFVYYGNAGGLSLRPQQRRADDAAPLAPGTRGDEVDAFRLAALARSPFGRTKVKLEREVKPHGAPLDGSGTFAAGSWTDSGTGGASLNQLVSGLNIYTQYHWRLRLRYHPACNPFAQHSRWFTIPVNGWQEADLRTDWVDGDLDCSNSLDLLDVPAFVAALLGPDVYLASYDCQIQRADLNGDGQINGLDIQRRIDLPDGP